MPSGYCASPITKDIPFGTMKFTFITSEDIPDEKRKQRNKSFIEKAVIKYYALSSIFENKDRVFLRNSIDYYNRSLKDDRLEEKLIDLMIALESLVSNNEKDELALRYSLRIAFLVSVGNETNRPEIFKMVKTLYDKRSKIVHGESEVKLDFTEVYAFQEIINRAIRRLIYIKQSKDDFYKLLDQAIYDQSKKQVFDEVVKEAIRQW